MANFRKFISVSAVAVLAATNLLTSLTYAAGAKSWAELSSGDLRQNPLSFIMPNHDVYLYAVTAPNTYYVEYLGNGATSGTAYQTGYVYDTTGDLLENRFEKVGYTFKEWNSQSDGSGSSYDENEHAVYNWTGEDRATVPVYAQWDANVYHINYDLNDSDGTSSGVHTKTPATGEYDKTLTIAKASRTGYTFSGWYITGMAGTHTIGTETGTESSATTDPDETSFANLRNDTGTVTFAARWKANTDTKYEVRHYLEQLSGGYLTGDDYDDRDQETGTTDTEVKPAAKDFSGYDNTNVPYSGNIDADGKTIFYYKYPRVSYLLTLIPGRGVESVSWEGEVTTGDSSTTNTGVKFKYDEEVTLGFTLKNGYTGGVWSGYLGTADVFNMPASNDEEKTASATPIVYTITGDYHGGTGADNETKYLTSYTVESDDITLPKDPEIKRPHSSFSGWIWEGHSTPTKDVTVASGSYGNKLYEAVWDCDQGYKYDESQPDDACIAETDIPYTVYYMLEDLAGGTYNITGDEKHLTGATDSPATVPAKSFSGFTLSGAESKTIGGDGQTTVIVQYNRDSYTYTVTQTTGVTVGVAADSEDDGKIKFEDEVTLTHDEDPGYEFSGWIVTGPDGAITPDANGKFNMPAGSVTITPVLTKTTYAITYDLNSGHLVGTDTNPDEYNVETPTFTLHNPERDHSIFVGWSGTDISGTSGTVTIVKGSTGPRTYEAIWRCNDGYHASGNNCVANEYTIAINYDDDDKSNTTVTGDYDEWIEIENPSKSGYIFSGWRIEGMSGDVTHYIGGSGSTTTDTGANGVTGTGFKNLTTEYPNGEVTFIAEWIAEEDTEYEVYHYVQNTGGTAYELVGGEPVTHTGRSDDPIDLNEITNSYVGFNMTGRYESGTTAGPIGDKITSITIDRHGTTKIYIYYDRDVNTVYLSGDAHIESLSWDARDFRYGEEVTVSGTVKTGYHFETWEKRGTGFAALGGGE